MPSHPPPRPPPHTCTSLAADPRAKAERISPFGVNHVWYSSKASVCCHLRRPFWPFASQPPPLMVLMALSWSLRCPVAVGSALPHLSLAEGPQALRKNHSDKCCVRWRGPIFPRPWWYFHQKTNLHWKLRSILHSAPERTPWESCSSEGCSGVWNRMDLHPSDF